MYKEIKVGVSVRPFKCTALTPVLYKSVFGLDWLKLCGQAAKEADRIEREKKEAEERGEVWTGDEVSSLADHVPELAYIMNKQGEGTDPWKLSKEGFYEWLDELEPTDVLKAAPDILQLYNAQKRTTSTAKKNLK